ncbi:hypothetical protein DERP_009502, partial [Dermatophagoides pteronyssinus]
NNNTEFENGSRNSRKEFNGSARILYQKQRNLDQIQKKTEFTNANGNGQHKQTNIQGLFVPLNCKFFEHFKNGQKELML